MDALLAVLLGLGLAASAGFRVFVPLLVASIAASSGHVTLAGDFAWLGSTPALVMLSVATVLEIAAFKVPWLDNLLDTLAVPAAVIAGSLLTAACIADMTPLLRWATAIIAGGGTAGMVGGGMAMARAASTGLTGGIANPVLAAVESASSVVVAVAAVITPLLWALLLLAVGLVVARQVRAPSDAPS